MRSKAAFIVGTGLGYVLGTRAGRQRFEKIKAYAGRAWQNPQVQARKSELQAKAADLAKTEAAALKGKVTENLRTAAAARKGETATPVERHSTAPSYPASALSDTTVDAPPFASPPGTQTGTGDLP